MPNSKSSLPTLNQELPSDETRRFTKIIMESNCQHYASDFLGTDNVENVDKVEQIVQHTLEIFQTLQLSTDGHFYLVYRCTPQYDIVKDWKLSELACAYMLLKGSPTNLRGIANQQSMFINEMLRYLKTKNPSPVNYGA